MSRVESESECEVRVRRSGHRGESRAEETKGSSRSGLWLCPATARTSLLSRVSRPCSMLLRRQSLTRDSTRVRSASLRRQGAVAGRTVRRSAVLPARCGPHVSDYRCFSRSETPCLVEPDGEVEHTREWRGTQRVQPGVLCLLLVVYVRRGSGTRGR